MNGNLMVDPTANGLKAGEPYLRAIENDPDSKRSLMRTRAHLQSFINALRAAEDSNVHRNLREKPRNQKVPAQQAAEVGRNDLQQKPLINVLSAENDVLRLGATQTVGDEGLEPPTSTV